VDALLRQVGGESAQGVAVVFQGLGRAAHGFPGEHEPLQAEAEAGADDWGSRRELGHGVPPFERATSCLKTRRAKREQ